MINWAHALNINSFPDKPEKLRVEQTHISFVFIDRFVYKIKKPVNFGFLDYTTLEKRKFFCEKEIELNSRLCPDIYLGVVPISETKYGYKVENSENPVEYAVKMKRLPEEGMMQNILNQDALTKKHIDLIVDILVSFYKSAKTGTGVNEYGSIDTVSFNTEENFAQTEKFVGKALNKWRYNAIINWTRTFIKKNASVFHSRIKEGYIREGHGDLYSANICFDNLKKVYIFDCVEFNERFRCGDVAGDIAFLSMDLDFHGYWELSKYFIESYIERSGDRGLIKVLNFYKCYRAYVRGKIACFTSEDSSLTDETRQKELEQAQRYFDLACIYSGFKPRIFVVFGFSGTGKSTIARELKNHTLSNLIASDIVRKNLAGLPPEEHKYEPFEQGIYTQDFTNKTYKKMIDLAKEESKKGRDVILDATFLKKHHRELVMTELCLADIYWIWSTAEDSVIKERFKKRALDPDISDARWEIYLAQKKRFEEPIEISSEKLIKIDTTKKIETLIETITTRVYK
ncbi:MAG TPA: AAA family ATPase [Thermodesulfovibrio thiophilus]|nr:AAA family ATPase [Thermodesulfovibrio thiophilus]